MKKFILSLTFALMGITSLFAARAHSCIAKLTLADGTEVQARLYGDENFHYYMTLDGTPLTKNADGKYVKTTIEEVKSWQEEANTARMAKASSVGQPTPRYFPHTGSPRALVILVQFQDVKFKSQDPIATFKHYLNGRKGSAAPAADAEVYSTKKSHTNYGSVYEYFKDMSDGKFTPNFTVVGPVTMSHNSAYYGKDSSKPGKGSDDNMKQMISEACAEADKYDFLNTLDSDNDGFVDLVYIIYAGYSQSWGGNDDDCLWPKSGVANFYKYDNDKGSMTKERLYVNGKRVARYGINNELNETPADNDNGKYYLNGIGLFCHEFSHTLGLPDLYNTNENLNNQSPDSWDLMDGGEYTNNGYCPTPYSPWEKEIMGWSTPTTLSPDEPQQITLPPYGETSASYKIEAETDGEYLLLQNIQNTGWYQYLYGNGLLVWRIDYADKSAVNLTDNPNNIQGKPRVMIVPADGELLYSLLCGNGQAHSMDEWIASIKNDTFPAYGIGQDGKDVDCLTSVELNHSTLTTRPLYNIKNDKATGIVTFDYLKDYSTGIRNAIVDQSDNRPTQYFDLEGRKISSPQKGHLYITNKGKKIVY